MQDISPEAWESWNKLLSPLSKGVSRGGRNDSDTLAKLYELSVELRNRLRFSQQSVQDLKYELKSTQTEDAKELVLVLVMIVIVQSQAQQMEAQEAECENLRHDNSTLRTQLGAAAAHADQAFVKPEICSLNANPYSLIPEP
eukprot:gene1324-32680_t